MDGLIYFIILMVVIKIISSATKSKARTGQTNKVEEQRRLKEAYNAQMRQRQSRQTVESQGWDSSWEEDEDLESEGTYFEGPFVENNDEEDRPQEQPALTSWEDVVRRYVEPTTVKPSRLKSSHQVKPTTSQEGGTLGQGQSSYEGTSYGQGQSSYEGSSHGEGATSLEGNFRNQSLPRQKTDTVVGKPTPALTTRNQAANPWELANLVEKNNLLNGIILSEILGSPKAKTMNRVMNKN